MLSQFSLLYFLIVSLVSYVHMYSVFFLKKYLRTFVILFEVSEAAACKVTSTPSTMGVGLPVVYNFSCTDTCSYWVLYILDSSIPLGGRCSNLPCVVETSSIDNESKVARQSLRLKISGSWMTVASNGSIMALAQCAFSYQTLTLFRAAVMLRQVKTGTAIASSSPSILEVTTQSSPKEADVPTPQTISPPVVDDALNSTKVRPLPEDRGYINGR